jgi:hypothetical protein
MAQYDEYQLRAVDCLQRMESAKSEADKRAWKMLAGSWLLLRRLQKYAEQGLTGAKSEVMKLQDYVVTKRDTNSKVA